MPLRQCYLADCMTRRPETPMTHPLTTPTSKHTTGSACPTSSPGPPSLVSPLLLCSIIRVGRFQWSAWKGWLKSGSGFGVGALITSSARPAPTLGSELGFFHFEGGSLGRPALVLITAF